LAILLLVTTLQFGCGKKKEEPPAPAPTPTPVPVLPRRNYDIARLYTGLRVRTSVDFANGSQTASATYAESNAYAVDISLRVRWPSAATNMAQIAEASPGIADALPGLPLMLDGIQPSPDYATLLANKERSLQSHLASLQKLPYRDSLFDCQTILDLRNPATGRKALLVQAIMNVNTDGSDGDRNLAIDRLSATFQPQTSYRWPKTGVRTNPCLGDAVLHLGELDARLGSETVTGEALKTLREERDLESATVGDLKRWDFLVGPADPFIVLPSFMLGKKPGQPVIGDYAVVLSNGRAYPAVVGDMGPNNKIGEASLRICREINRESGADRRPVSTPGVVYVVFPGTADKPFTSPDYAHWSARCRALWEDFGGNPAIPWQEWTSLEQPWPTPTPSPSPSSTSPESAMPTPIPTPTPPKTSVPDGTHPASILIPTPSPASSPATSVLPSSDSKG
jgi:hypothetical protein